MTEELKEKLNLIFIECNSLYNNALEIDLNEFTDESHKINWIRYVERLKDMDNFSIEFRKALKVQSNES